MRIQNIVFLLLFFSINASAQSWYWAKIGVGPSNNEVEGFSVAEDKSNNVYMSGSFLNTVIFGNDTLNTLGIDVYLVKYDSSGNVLWAVQSTGGNGNEGYSVTMDMSGNVYMTGIFDGNTTFGSYTLNASVPEVFLVKYNSNGKVIWAQQAYNSTGNIGNNLRSLKVAVDKWNNVYITGSFSNTLIFGQDTLISPHAMCAFLAKYDSAGKLLWARQPNSATSYGYSLATDLNGNVYMGGQYLISATFGSYTLISRNNADYPFLVKYDSSGTALWARNATVSSTASSCVNSIITDASGYVYFTGYIKDSVAFSSNTLYSPTYDAFVAKYSSNGDVIWAEAPRVMDHHNWVAWSLAEDSIGHLYIAGSCDSNKCNLIFDTVTLKKNFPYTPDGSSFIFMLDTAGKVFCGSLIGGGGDDQNAITADPAGSHIYFGGDFDDIAKIAFGNITVVLPPYGGEWPFISHWKPCCGVIPHITSKSYACSGQPDTLSAGGGYNYVWSNGDTVPSIVITPFIDTTYYVTVSSGKCSAKTSTVVKVSPTPVINISPPQSICFGQSTEISASGGSYYMWSNGSKTSSISVNPSSNQTYIVTATIGLCSAKDSTVVNVKSLPITSICCDSNINPSQSVQLSATGGVTYTWTPSIGLSCISCSSLTATPFQSITYTVAITNDSNCSVYRLVTINVACNIFVPEAFSPNGDGQNDILYVRGDCIKTMQFDVFDRWGNKVFETNDKNTGWDGRCRSEPMNSGSYVYYLTTTLYDGTTQTKKGNVTLVR